MGIKKKTIKFLFCQFAVSLIGMLALAVIVPFVLEILAVNAGLATKANQSELKVKEIIPILMSAPDIETVVIPQDCDYLILDKNFNELSSNMSSEEKEAALLYAKGEYMEYGTDRKYELVVIDLLNLNFQICAYPARLNGVADLIFHKDKGLQVLETQVNEDGTCQNLVASIRIRNGACVSTPAFSWEGRHTGKYFDGRYVWENGYMIRDLDTGEYFSLLENSEIRVPEKHAPLAYTYYPEDKYLQIIDTQQNFFIDCKKRKIIARYFTDPKSGSYQGVLAEREFLIGYADGIYSMPFPTIEMQTV